MGNDLHILHLADTHIGAALPARPRADRRYRGNDLVEKYNQAVTAALKEDAKILIHAGDVFDTPAPHAFAVHAATSPLLAAAAAGARVFVVPGNHERSDLPAALMLAHPNIHIFRQPETVVFQQAGLRIAMIGIPCIRRGARKQFAVQLAETQWALAKADLNVLICHQAFVGAVCGIQNYRFPVHEDNISPADIPSGIHYVAAGHIHRHQSIALPSGDGEIVYAGSLERVSFVEREESKGVIRVVVGSAGLQARFVEHEVRPMAVVPIDITGFDKARIRSAVDDALLSLPPHAVAQLRISGQITRDMIAGLGVAERVRRLRPAAHVELNFRAVEYAPQRTVARSGPSIPKHERRHDRTASPDATAFACSIWRDLPGGPHRVQRLSVTEMDRVPQGRGNYALFARDGRLLYIGKAAQSRARVRTHLNPRSPKNAFGSWTRDATHVEIRPAASEFEATMIEFELIRRYRPPFNRQFREARAPYFLVVGGREFGQLDVARMPQADVASFGPFGSRFNAELVRDLTNSFYGCAECPRSAGKSGFRRARLNAANRLPLLAGNTTARLCDKYFAGVCTGPCATKITAAAYTDRVTARNRFLMGEDDQALRSAEAAYTQAAVADTTVAPLWEPEAHAEQIRAASATNNNPATISAVNGAREAGDDFRPPAPPPGTSAEIEADERKAQEETLRYLRHTFDRAARLRTARTWAGVAFAEHRPDNRLFLCIPRADHFAFAEAPQRAAPSAAKQAMPAGSLEYSSSMTDGVVLLARMLETNETILKTPRDEQDFPVPPLQTVVHDIESLYGATPKDVTHATTSAATPPETNQLYLFA
ncbi:MAG: metallophosphoesterase [Phycisphaerae bacterium]